MTALPAEDKYAHAKGQALAQFESIAEMVAALREAGESGSSREEDDAREAIHEDPLSVEVRSDWYSPGARDADTQPAEYCILLCTGGPAVRIIGKLSGFGEPESATLQYQDWFTPWCDWDHPDIDPEETLLAYAQCFYFGE